MANVKEFLNNNLVDLADASYNERKILKKFRTELPKFVAHTTKEFLYSINDDFLRKIVNPSPKNQLTYIVDIQVAHRYDLSCNDPNSDALAIWGNNINSFLCEYVDLLRKNCRGRINVYIERYIESFDDSFALETGTILTNLLGLDPSKFEISLELLDLKNAANRFRAIFEISYNPGDDGCSTFIDVFHDA